MCSRPTTSSTTPSASAALGGRFRRQPRRLLRRQLRQPPRQPRRYAHLFGLILFGFRLFARLAGYLACSGYGPPVRNPRRPRFQYSSRSSSRTCGQQLAGSLASLPFSALTAGSNTSYELETCPARGLQCATSRLRTARVTDTHGPHHLRLHGPVRPQAPLHTVRAGDPSTSNAAAGSQAV